MRLIRVYGGMAAPYQSHSKFETQCERDIHCMYGFAMEAFPEVKILIRNLKRFFFYD